MKVLFQKLIAGGNVGEKAILATFSSVQGTAVCARRNKEGLIIITLQTNQPDSAHNKTNLEHFVFERELLHYQKGYRNLMGKEIKLTMEELQWEFRRKSYRINSKGMSIKLIGR